MSISHQCQHRAYLLDTHTDTVEMRPCSWPPIQRPMKAIRASFVPSTMPGKCAGNSFPESKRQSWPFFFQLVKHPHTPHFSFRPPRTLICSTRTLGHSLTALPLDIIQTLITSIHLPSRIYFNYFETPYPTNALSRYFHNVISAVLECKRALIAVISSSPPPAS